MTRDEFDRFWTYDPETGLFYSKRTNRYVRPQEGGYVRLKFNGKRFFGHRVAWWLCAGEWPAADIDHVNCNRGDNRIANLRLATSSQNKWNTSGRNGATGIKGVFVDRGRGCYMSSIRVNGHRHYLGRFTTVAAAAAAYRAAAERFHGEFARVA